MSPAGTVPEDFPQGAPPRPPRIASLHLYPLKSAAGIALPSVDVDEMGLLLDRRWMVVDAGGRFMSQRTHPRMALLTTGLADDSLQVGFPGAGAVDLPLEAEASPAGDGVRVRVWDEDRLGDDCGDGAASWMSAALGTPCRVLRARVPADGARLSTEGRVRAGFADARPALVISTASLADLNRRLQEQGTPPLPMDRFRPNIVAEGIPPYGEDEWVAVRVGAVSVRGVHPCPRCVTTTVDQATGTAAGPEPLRILATYRRMDRGGPAFGMNVAFESPGTLSVGDAISV